LRNSFAELLYGVLQLFEGLDGGRSSLRKAVPAQPVFLFDAVLNVASMAPPGRGVKRGGGSMLAGAICSISG